MLQPLFALALAPILFTIGLAASPCGWTSVAGSTFDLSPLRLSDGSYAPSAFSDDRGASMKLNLCANVPDSEIPDVCASLVKTVGYKMYYIGERQVCSDLGFQQYGHWSLIDSGNPEVGVRVEYGFGPQYSSAVRQSVQYDIYCDCSSGSGYPEVSSCPSLAVFPIPTVHSVCKMKWASSYGCPYKCTGWQHTFLFLFFLSGIAYFGGGLLYNVKRLGMPLEKQSLPHYVFWTELLPELVKEGMTYTILTARGLAVPPSRGSYDKL